MSGELQTIPARHGVATFVPRGRTIKIINTYGKQVVSTWAFGLNAPPEDDEDKGEEIEDDIEEKTKELKEEWGNEDQSQNLSSKEKGKAKEEDDGEASSAAEPEQKHTSSDDNDDPPEQAPDTPENEKTTETTQEKKTEKRTWSSYLPSIPYRNKGGAAATEKGSQVDKEAEKAQNEATSKKWSSYLPTGQSFSSYVPNVQLPDSKGVVSAFQASHNRDPNKSYAEQLYDFSKTPVGAGGIAAATGSGTASSLYAAYSAYTKLNPNKADQPPMEYLSLPHTRAATHRLVPEVGDTLLTNLRTPIMTLVEDTTPGAHDTLTAACDASLYAAIGVEKPEEHGSCAVNLVLALKELNGKAGLQGTKAVGADITVNIAPTPLHLFMNAPIEIKESSQGDGSGARGAELKVEEPKSKKRSFVRFRAERDIVIVMSACPMEIGSQNGGRCMAANFMVEEASEEKAETSAPEVKKSKPKKISPKKEETPAKQEETPKKEDADVEDKPKPLPTPRGGPAKFSNVKKPAARRDSAAEASNDVPKNIDKPAAQTTGEEAPKAKKKPKKLERRSATPAK
ncbi:hypothetical protein BU24DRAFT_30651 [Aaosphaeria arxii CBS 175.79]|uniref:DUF1989 domain-containing protein n=1 Tax=Aaosphaeria arxii CBS 175.79 TaxID=1450172 RepID=A0A6A5Y8D4_9PLEO|nr:uncharacterized protein BU24DRAFT_30651 [Aaosphaeria arxii CBS 175.79]KAF2021852.1 hypothetical protein BU24DRAFT_30651 [Aaosphaeria arxii CBS 175.79]